jgi:hypothetical protein
MSIQDLKSKTWTIPYDSSLAKKEVVTAQQLFGQKKPDKCPITTCTVKPKGCTEESVTRVGVSENKIVADSNVLEGYTQELCVECSNGIDTLKQDGLTFVQ